MSDATPRQQRTDSATDAAAPAVDRAARARRALRGSPLEHAETLPLYAPDLVDTFGPTLVIAPHPDDESLACGGLLALLAQRGLPAHVLVLTDGQGSHPGSKRYPPQVLGALRRAELVAALHELGLRESDITHLDMPDRHAPRRHASSPAAFAAAVARMSAALDALPFRPQTIWAPWQREPHTDHRSAWELLTAALSMQPDWQPRVIAWPLWVFHIAEDGDPPLPEEVSAWRLDISSVLPAKRAAIAAHVSQVTDLIADADTPWHLSSTVLAHFTQPWEVGLDVAPDVWQRTGDSA